MIKTDIFKALIQENFMMYVHAHVCVCARARTCTHSMIQLISGIISMSAPFPSVNATSKFQTQIFLTNLYEKWDGDENGENKHAPKAIQVQCPPSCTIHERNGHKCHSHHNGTNANCSELSTLFREPRANEQQCWIVEHLQCIQHSVSAAKISQLLILPIQFLFLKSSATQSLLWLCYMPHNLGVTVHLIVGAYIYFLSTATTSTRGPNWLFMNWILEIISIGAKKQGHMVN